ncbi:uncharacterized protein LMH87_008990 [Akanthomyces muscarius]|uniref:Acyl-CoA N-acyltransferase n=1 Tax=Akanthomyces muscarius TaxID=2231603 RepID=A0A9W8UQ80_AKAMU|nr:uncharacterized protein LMH87_008990 [Akanthomyces muscarius]KAJ4158466.1 hypothetical protein LMH87_008990 [Akanthomyces muscarius]
MAAKDRLDGDFEQRSSQEVVMDSPQAKEITGVDEVKGHENAEVSPLPKEPLTSEAFIGIDDAQDKSSNKSNVPVEQDQYPPSLRNSQEQASQSKSVSSVDTARKKALELASKWKIPSEAIQDQDRATPEAKDSISCWSISALGEEPVTPPVAISPRQDESENLNNDGPSEKVEELNSADKPRSLTVAAWVMDTEQAPLPNLVIPKAANASAHCCAIDPETGAFLPAIEHPETRLNHELEVQSEPGWHRGHITSDMQIIRELKARARLAQRLKERLPTPLEVESPAPDEGETTFPKADCTIRPATDDDIAGISEIINLDRQANEEAHRKAPSGIKSWDIVKIFNKCRKEQRPFLVATGGEDDLLDRSKWPAGADKAFQEYVKYRSNSSGPTATIVGFAFAMPRQGPSLDAQEIHVDHSCYVNLCVHPAHRNKKYATALLDRILMSVSPIHRSLIDFEWKCDDPAEIYEQPASNNAQQYARIFVEYPDAHDEDQRLRSRKKLLEKFGFSQVGHLTCLRSESRGGKRYWLDLFIWELEAQSLENVR